ncbi:MAG: AraC family transcriptional regulator [bacterium]|nr:AraC family transcriptional regulator [bacterium]
MLDAYKELVPVVYGESSIKLLYAYIQGADRMCFGMHWHDRMELNLVISGSMMLHTDEGHYEVKPGQIAVNAPRRMHCGIAGGEYVEYHTLMFDIEKFCNQTPASEKYLVPILKGDINFPRVIEDKNLKAEIEQLIHIEKDRTAYHPLQAESKIYEILGILSRYGSTTTRADNEKDKRFHTILKYINENFTDKITPKDISLKFGYNETYFCRRFKEITGLTFTKYVQALRMEMAIKLLKSGKEEIRYIAWKCGYEDVSYFSNCFKSHFGFRPSKIYGTEG